MAKTTRMKISVGTAKPHGEWGDTAYKVEGISYHLIDIWDPSKPFTAADFVRLSEPLIERIIGRGKLPILVGGTGLYFKALLEGLAPLPAGNPALRTKLRARADEIGRVALHAELAAFDPEAAMKIPANNIQRVVRALEVFQLTGKPISQFHQEHQANKQVRYQAEMIGVDPGKESLDARLQDRCSDMLENGMIEETEALLKQDFAADCPALTGLGYPRVVKYLKGEFTDDELYMHLLQDTRQYAKRQRTWFRNQMKVTWPTSANAAGTIGRTKREG